jgi:hypothetical protein
VRALVAKVADLTEEQARLHQALTQHEAEVQSIPREVDSPSHIRGD